MTLSGGECGHPGRRENLSGEVWVTRSPVINEFLQKAVHVYMACLCAGEGISFSDQGHVSLAHSQQFLWAQTPEKVQPRGFETFPCHPAPDPHSSKSVSPSSITCLQCPLTAGSI